MRDLPTTERMSMPPVLTPMGTTRPGRCITTPVTTCGRSVTTRRRLTITAHPQAQGTALAGAGRAGMIIAHRRGAGLGGGTGRATGTMAIMAVATSVAGAARLCAAAL